MLLSFLGYLSLKQPKDQQVSSLSFGFELLSKKQSLREMWTADECQILLAVAASTKIRWQQLLGRICLSHQSFMDSDLP